MNSRVSAGTAGRLLIAALGAAACCLVMLGTGVVAGRAATASTIPVKRCPTQFGVTGTHSAPSRLRVDGSPSSVAGLVAYTDYATFLIGPSGLDCKGLVGVDGGSSLIAWRHGQREPGAHSREAGLTLDQQPACVGCQADLVCPILPALANVIYPGYLTTLGGCPGKVAAGEIVSRVTSRLARFTDPAGVAGNGDPSGGPYAAEGAVGYGGSRIGAFETTCTLPASQRRICRVSLNDAISRYH